MSNDNKFKTIVEKLASNDATKHELLRMLEVEIYPYADIMHTLFCTKSHADDMSIFMRRSEYPILCFFYLENNLEPTWEQPTHKEWLDKTREIISQENEIFPEFLTKPLSIAQKAIEYLHMLRAENLLIYRLLLSSLQDHTQQQNYQLPD